MATEGVEKKERWILPHQAGVMLDCDEKTARTMAHDGRLVWRRRGGKKRRYIEISIASIQAYQQSNSESTDSTDSTDSTGI